MLLCSCPTGARVRLNRIDVDPAHRLRLGELGMRPGAELRLTNRAAFGGIVVTIAGTRIAVDRRSTRRIEVQMIEDQPAAPAGQSRGAEA